MKSTGMFVAQRQPLLMFAVSRGTCLLVRYSAADCRFLLTLFKRGPRQTHATSNKQFFFLFLRTEVL